jgi:hypothetical protein
MITAAPRSQRGRRPQSRSSPPPEGMSVGVAAAARAAVVERVATAHVTQAASGAHAGLGWSRMDRSYDSLMSFGLK